MMVVTHTYSFVHTFTHTLTHTHIHSHTHTHSHTIHSHTHSHTHEYIHSHILDEQTKDYLGIVWDNGRTNTGGQPTVDSGHHKRWRAAPNTNGQRPIG